MPVSDGRQAYESGIDAEAWQSGVSESGSEWAQGLSQAGQAWADGISEADWAEAIEADPSTNGSVPESIVSKWRNNSANSQSAFENSGDDEAQRAYEAGATDDAAQQYRSNADGQAWEDGYSDLSSWG